MVKGKSHVTWAHAGRAAWLDKDKTRCIILWKTHPEWASTIIAWARDCGHTDSVVTLEELSSGDDVDGTGDALYCSGPGVHHKKQLELMFGVGVDFFVAPCRS